MAKGLARIRPTAPPRLRPIVMGVLNLTPDSFSDGGRYFSDGGALDVDAAIAHALALRGQGADLIDVGGESTRPGAERIDPAVEIDRILAVVTGLVERNVPVSVDTMNAETALAVADAGVAIINDVSGGLADPEMYRTVAATGVNYIASHWRGPSVSMDELTDYDNVVLDVRDALKARIAELLVWGVSPDRIVIDPGLGFAKTSRQNWELLSALPELRSLGYPILIGASRKRFLAEFADDGAPVTMRDFPTAITSVLAAREGVWGVRVHDVPSTVTALDVWSAWRSGGKRE